MGRSADPTAWNARRKAIALPSGDHSGPKSLPALHGAGSSDVQPETWCGFEPSAFMTQIPSLSGAPLAYAIWDPSGLQSGTWSFIGLSVVSACGLLPSAFITHTCELIGFSAAS